MKFSEQLSYLMKTNGTTITELSKFVGVSRQSVMRWLDGSMPAADKMARISKFYSVRFDGLADDQDDADYRVPIIGSIRAGYPIESFPDHQGYVNSNFRNNGDLFALKVVGDSMMPLVMDGDIIICNRNTANANGKICAVTIDGESTLKRMKADSTGVTLVPTNPLYPEMRYSSKKAEELGFRVDGVLVQMIRNF